MGTLTPNEMLCHLADFSDDARLAPASPLPATRLKRAVMRLIAAYAVTTCRREFRLAKWIPRARHEAASFDADRALSST